MSYFSRIKILNALASVINPATEEKQDTMIANQTNKTQFSKITDGSNDVTLLNSYPTGSEYAIPVRSVDGFLGTVDPNNSTTANLTGGASFVGTATDTLPYGSVYVQMYSDVASATGGVSCQWSPDGVSWDTQRVLTLPALTWMNFTHSPHGRYFRISYTNGASAQSTFKLQTVLTKAALTGEIIPVDGAPVPGCDALLTKSVISGKTTAGGGSYVDVKVSPSGAVQIGGTLDAITSLPLPAGAATSAKQDTIIANQTNGTQVVRFPSMSTDTGGRIRVGQITTLFDGKILNQEDTLLWDTKGTGTATYSGNKITMSVTAGQYLVRQSKQICPYFSGKPQFIEITYDDFNNQANVVKRAGYFSSNAVAPYDSNKDGIWLEADGTTYRLICSNDGTEIFNVPWTSWDAYSEISGYDWTKFTVMSIDFLWLGGAGLRFFMVINGTFKLVHTISTHAGYNNGLFIKYPNQFVRYEIRSTTGTGTLDSICSQVSSEGSVSEEGKSLSLYNPTGISCNSIGTIYALKSVRKTSANRNVSVTLESFGGGISGATNDSGLLMLLLNPTLSAPISYSNNSRVQEGSPTNQTITVGTGRLISSIQIVASGTSVILVNNVLKRLQVGVDNTMGEIVLAYMPYTSNQTVAGTITLTEY